jgi:hypothetical protein
VDDTLLGADPSELTVVDEMSPGLAPVCDEGGEGPALETLGDVVDGCTDDVVSTADGEGLEGELASIDMFCSRIGSLTIPWPVYSESVSRMQ